MTSSEVEMEVEVGKPLQIKHTFLTLLAHYIISPKTGKRKVKASRRRLDSLAPLLFKSTDSKLE